MSAVSMPRPPQASRLPEHDVEPATERTFRHDAGRPAHQQLERHRPAGERTPNPKRAFEVLSPNICIGFGSGPGTVPKQTLRLQPSLRRAAESRHGYLGPKATSSPWPELRAFVFRPVDLRAKGWDRATGGWWACWGGASVFQV